MDRFGKDNFHSKNISKDSLNENNIIGNDSYVNLLLESNPNQLMSDSYDSEFIKRIKKGIRPLTIIKLEEDSNHQDDFSENIPMD